MESAIFENMGTLFRQILSLHYRRPVMVTFSYRYCPLPKVLPMAMQIQVHLPFKVAIDKGLMHHFQVRLSPLLLI